MAFKICPKCNEKCPARIRRCKKCDSVFAFKIKSKSPKTRKVPMSNWKELKEGDHIKVSGGPVWVDKENNETSMGYSGLYVVVDLDQNGILARGTDKFSGYCHIWMGDEILNNIGITKRPHNVFKVNLK